MYALSEGSEPSPFFNFATAPSFWTDVILLKSVSAEAVARQSYHADFPLWFPATPLALSPPCFLWPCLCLSDVPSWSSGSSWIASSSSGYACLIFWGCLLVVSSTFDAVCLRFFNLGGIIVAGVGVVLVLVWWKGEETSNEPVTVSHMLTNWW